MELLERACDGCRDRQYAWAMKLTEILPDSIMKNISQEKKLKMTDELVMEWDRQMQYATKYAMLSDKINKERSLNK